MSFDVLAALSQGIVSGASACDYPAESDVRYGVSYGTGSLTGTLGYVNDTGSTHSPADIIRTLLITLGGGSDPESNSAWPIFSDREPTAPDESITVYNTEGRFDGRVMTGEIQGPRGIQVRVRSKTPASGWAKSSLLRTLMAEGIHRDYVTVGAARYLVQSVAKIGNVIALGKESPTSQRNIFTINAVTTITQCDL